MQLQGIVNIHWKLRRGTGRTEIIELHHMLGIFWMKWTQRTTKRCHIGCWNSRIAQKFYVSSTAEA
ncbi:hypothetical protein T4E_2704 [Trichinella pseudospiralis]|uniref:Uncharacterized protein n=1 Tax=Trichinella pseudospiralis TaxID=6337 RepID=A0A0V0XH17_TRIPS|nr:hypothetical protein T4E_2704 [Trichinella pseudospiralis]